MEKQKKGFFESLKNFTKTMVDKQPLSSQNAYSIASIGKTKSMDEMYETFKLDVLDNIKFVAERGDYYCMIKFPTYLITDYKENILKYLSDLQYKIVFYNTDIFIVTWKIN